MVNPNTLLGTPSQVMFLLGFREILNITTRKELGESAAHPHHILQKRKLRSSEEKLLP